MIVEDRKMNVTSTLTGEKIGMRIDESALSHIMSVLTDLYSDPEMAVIREYSTNAYDSHIQAGISRPIEITLPTPLSPFFRVRDFGVGMDIDDIRDIYSRYGTSTKRASNDVVGMLGLGCKSALTYTDQFTLTGIKDGISTQVSVSRDADGAGSMTIVAQTPTDKPAGVEIIVPAKSGNRFETKANSFFRFWDEGLVLVNSKPVKKIDGTWITKDIVLTTDLEASYVVMGNVPYPLPTEYQPSRYNAPKSVSFVEIGDVSFVPSREQLQMTARTKETVTRIKVIIERETQKALQKRIDDAPNRWEAIKQYSEVSRLGYSSHNPPNYRGEEIPPKTEAGQYKDGGLKKSFLVVSVNNRWGRKGDNFTSISLLMQQNSFWFTNYTAEFYSPYKRLKFEQWLEKKGLDSPQNIVGVRESKVPDSQWINPDLIFDWAEIEAEKITKEKKPYNGDGRPTGSYHAYVAGTYQNDLLAGDIDVSKPIFWQHGSAYDKGVDAQYLMKRFPNCTLVNLTSNRIEKFKRDFPTAKNVNSYCSELAEEWKKGVIKDQLLAWKVGNSRIALFLKKLDASRIKDKELAGFITAAKVDITKLKEENNCFRHFGVTLPQEWDYDIEKAYPLLQGVATYAPNAALVIEHAYLYINTVH